MIRYVLVLVFVMGFGSILGQNLDIVRENFPHYNPSEISKHIISLENNIDPLAIVYSGALYLFKSKNTILPNQKYKYFKKGKTLIDRACSMSPNDIEIRYIRLIFQYQLPKFLGYYHEKEKDFQYFVTHFPNSNSSIKTIMLKNLLNLENLEADKIEILKNIS